MSVKELTTTPPTDSKSVLFFWASWHEATAPPKGSIFKLYETLASSVSTSISFYRIEAEAQVPLSSAYKVTVVPTFVLLDGDTVVEQIEGADDVARLTTAVSALRNRTAGSTATATATPPPPATTIATGSIGEKAGATPESNLKSEEEELNQRLQKLINSSQTLLFMKGSPNAPKCGFSRQAIEILTAAEISFATFDILSDNAVRQGLKTYSDWPTYPQLYVNGDLMGGLDIMKEMAEEGDLAEQLDVPKLTRKEEEEEEKESTAGEETLDDKLKRLTNRSKVMLFMKGLPSKPRCGFSRQICEILEEQGITFDAFDILEDEEVRQGLKAFSDWPTFPQVYVDGDMIGGLDIVKEMVESDELQDLI